MEPYSFLIILVATILSPIWLPMLGCLLLLVVFLLMVVILLCFIPVLAACYLWDWPFKWETLIKKERP